MLCLLRLLLWAPPMHWGSQGLFGVSGHRRPGCADNLEIDRGVRTTVGCKMGNPLAKVKA